MSIFDTMPIMSEEMEENIISGKTEKVIFVRWGDADFSMIDGTIEDIETWVHEFTECAISETLEKVEPSIDMRTIAQIMGNVDGLTVFWEGEELFGPLHHLLTSLVTYSYFPTHDGWVKISGDEMWEIIKPLKGAVRETFGTL